jgi:hypothetical protein
MTDTETRPPIDYRIAAAAVIGAGALIPPETLDAFEMGNDAVMDCVRFVRVAGDVPGESLYRWSAARNLHALPQDGFERINPDIRLFFDAFVAITKALAPLLEPAAAATPHLYPGRAATRAEDTIFEREDTPGARTHAGLAKETPATTQGLRIVHHHQLAELAARPSAPGEGPMRPSVVGPDMLERFAAGRMPTPAEIAEMTPEGRRAAAALFGLGNVDDILAETPVPGPEAEGLTPMRVDAQAQGAPAKEGETAAPIQVQGEGAVGKPKKSAK